MARAWKRRAIEPSVRANTCLDKYCWKEYDRGRNWQRVGEPGTRFGPGQGENARDEIE
jgi:hypothetical protein